MRRTTLLGWVGVVLISGAVGFLGVRLFRPDPAPPAAALPEFGTPIPAFSGVPVDGDVWEAATRAIESEVAGRDAASEAGVELELSEYSVEPVAGSAGSGDAGGGTGEDAGDDAGDDGGAPDPDSLPAPPSSGDGMPAEDRAVDECASAEPASGCPEGVGGTILFAIHSLPDLQGLVRSEPYAPGTASRNGEPECPPVAPAPGSVPIGVTTNRPVDITLSYWPHRGYGRTPVEEWRTTSLSTPDAAAAVWLSWLEDDTVGYEDPRYWIDHCLVLTDLEPGVYGISATLVDPVSGETFVSGIDGFDITDAAGEVPRQVRRPTALLALGVDRLNVVATRPSDQELTVVAREWTPATTCDTGGDLAWLSPLAPPEPGRIDSSTLESETAIDPALLTDPEYPYLPNHSISVSRSLELEEGNDYLVCLYWTRGGGPSFAPRELVSSEQIPVSTPDAYRPVITLLGFDSLIGSQESITVTVDHPFCDRHTVVFDPPYRATREIDPVTVCAPQNHLSGIIARGVIGVEFEIIGSDGVRTTGGAVINDVNLYCDFSPCAPRTHEMVRMLLPVIPTGGLVCGSGWGGCDPSDVPRRSAGYAVFELSFDPGDSSGTIEWSIGEAEPGGRRPAPLSSTPLLSVHGVATSTGDSAQLRVTVNADRPVTLQAEVMAETAPSPTCFIATPTPYASTGAAVRHEFTFTGLCHGEQYLVAFTGADADGNPVAVAHGPWLATTPDAVFFVPPLRLALEATVTMADPGSDEYIVYALDSEVLTPDFDARGIAGGGVLRGGPGTVDRDRLTSAGWRDMYGGGLCSVPNPEGLSLNHEGLASVGHFNLVVSMRLSLFRTRTVGTYCVRGELIAAYELSATVDLTELLSGITITSEDGQVSYQVRVVGSGFRG